MASDELTRVSSEPSVSEPVLIIAEAGVNHNGDVALAEKLVEEAKACGADAIKFQTFFASELCSSSAPMAAYQIANTGKQNSQLEMLRALELDRSAHDWLKIRCGTVGIEFLSSPFGITELEYLAELGVSRIKIPSGEITNIPFLKRVSELKLPTLLSTGMSTLAEVDAAVSALSSARSGLTLLHCTSLYPAPEATLNLRAIETLRSAFQLPVGYSDHSLGAWASLAAVALGATVIEKHFTLDKTLAGPDHAASMNPEEFRTFVTSIRSLERALGSGIKTAHPAEFETRQLIRKSIVARSALLPGRVLSENDLAIKRPGTGIAPGSMATLVGMTLRRELKADEPLSWEHLK